MENHKEQILTEIYYTDLVYDRINKKLNIDLSKNEIEHLVFSILNETALSNYQKLGKNYYISHEARNIRLTINSFTFRLITGDRIDRSQKVNI